jgi:hypothetical protein
MGVLSTYCQICGLPVQQDHYVPAKDGGYFHIWRGDGDDACPPAVDFGPERAWLRDAVGRAALHRVCWDMAGRPDAWAPLADLQPPAAQERYRQQLFEFGEFGEFVADGHGWMLADPAAADPDGLRNGQRIRANLGDRSTAAV